MRLCKGLRYPEYNLYKKLWDTQLCDVTYDCGPNETEEPDPWHSYKKEALH
jgi:hypothetical protein